MPHHSWISDLSGFHSYDKCKVYISTSMDILFLKIHKILHSLGFTVNSMDKYLQIEVKVFEHFIDTLSKVNILSELEREEINILPVGYGQEISFSILSRMKTLEKWSRIVQSKDLLYILEKKSMVSYFQPIIDLETNEIYGHELLIRGIKQDGLLMPPNDMIFLAQKNDLFFQFDQLAMQTCIQTAYHKKPKGKIFMNMAPSCLEKSFDLILDLVLRLELDPHQIVFELIEIEKIQDYERFKKFLDACKQKGFSIAMDDVGSGYSSLQALALLEPQYIKIERKIIENIHKEKPKQAILHALLQVAREMGIEVLGEGIERKEELRYLMQQGIRLGQGYLFSRPVPKPMEKIKA